MNHKGLENKSLFKKLGIGFFFFLLCNFVSAQFTDIYNYPSLHTLKFDSLSTEIGMSYNTFSSSNSIKNAFVNALLKKKYLSRELRSSNPVQSQNYFGTEDNACFYVNHMPDSLFGYSKLGYRISLENSFHGDLKFSNDLYNLAFFGNKKYAGKTVDFSKTYANFMQYQQIKFGLFKQSGNVSEPFTFYFGLGFIKGQQFASLETDTATLFTEEWGEYLDLNLHAKYLTSDTVKRPLSHFNGYGGCADIAFIYENKKSNLLFNFSLNDIGYIKWNKSSMIVPLDTILHWDGIAADSLVWGHDTSVAENFNKDSLQKIIYAHAKKTSFVKIIPKKVNISITKKFLNKTLFATFGLAYIFHANCPKPLFYMKGDYIFKNKISASLQAAYGGYDKFQMGLGIQAAFTKYFKIQIYSNNITGFIVPEKTFAQSIAGRIICNF